MDLSIEIITITLSCFAFLLLFLSFFKKDRVTEIEKQMEALSIQLMQENYQLKKRIKLLEEELIGLDTFPEDKDTY